MHVRLFLLCFAISREAVLTDLEYEVDELACHGVREYQCGGSYPPSFYAMVANYEAIV